MNQFFNIQRFAKYTAYDVRTNYKRYLIAVAIGAIGIFLLTYFFVFTSISTGSGFEERLLRNNFEVPSAATAIFMFCLLFFFSTFLLLSFPALSGKKSTMNYLLVPASTFEKYLLEFFIRIIVGFGLFLLVLYLMANFAIIAYESFLNFRFADIVANHQRSISVERFAFADAIRPFLGNIREEEMKMVWYVITACITAYLCAFSVRTLFSRFAFVKTLAVIIGAIILYIRLLMRLVENGIFDDIPTTSQFTWILIAPLVLIAISSLILGFYTLKRKRI